MWSMIVFFGWILFIWLLITVYIDLFRRHDIGGWGKAGWIIFTILLPFIGVFTYLIVEGRAMHERSTKEAQEAKAQMDEYVRSVSTTSTNTSADQIAKAKQLLDNGAITPDEFQALKQKALTG